jgi:ferredoxin
MGEAAATLPVEDDIMSETPATSKRGLRVYVDPKRCIANAKCTTAAPGIFVLDEETGIAVIENEDEATVGQLFAGARACPTQAIIIEQYGRRIYPRILTPMFGEGKQGTGAEERSGSE